MSAIRKLLAVLAGVLLLGYAVGFALPQTIHVERSLTINAPPETVFAEISDFHHWEAWSPWAEMDPEAEIYIIGTELGQTMVWSSEDPQVGNGNQKITAYESPTFFQSHLIFEDQEVGDASFALASVAGGTKVTWSFDGIESQLPVLARPVSGYLGLLVEPMLGPSYEQGLENLKAVVEK